MPKSKIQNLELLAERATQRATHALESGTQDAQLAFYYSGTLAHLRKAIALMREAGDSEG